MIIEKGDKKYIVCENFKSWTIKMVTDTPNLEISFNLSKKDRATYEDVVMCIMQNKIF